MWLRISSDDFAYDLVSGNDARIARRELTFYDAQVGPANAAGEHTQQNVSGLGIGSWNLFDLERRT